MKKYFTFFTLLCLSAFAYAQNIEDKLVNRLKKYAEVYTCSSYDSDEFPSTSTQRVLATLLAEELISFGIPKEDVTVDDYSYVYATIKGNVQDAPTVFLSAHLDTTPDAKFNTKAPTVKIHEYNGGDLVINEELGIVLTEEKNEFLYDAAGGRVITSDGETLLGGDDRAGMAVVMTLAETFATNPDIPHGDIRIIFTPDEEIGNSTTYLTKENIKADFGLVFDSHGFGRIVIENFNATNFTFTVKTPSEGHPGYSSQVPALRVLNNFAGRLPDRLAAFNSSGREGYMDYNDIENDDDQVRGRLRSFSHSELNRYKRKLNRKARRTARRYDMHYVEIINGDTIIGKNSSEPLAVLEMNDSYYNSKYVLEQYPENFALIKEAYGMADVKMYAESGRGGSDAGDITYMGIPTYNIFAGSHNEHSRDEWVSSKQMLASYNVGYDYLTLIAGQNRNYMLHGETGMTQPDIEDFQKMFDATTTDILNRYGNTFSNI